MEEHSPRKERNDRRDAREAKRSAGEAPFGAAEIGAQETVVGLALKKAQEATRGKGAEVSVGNEASDTGGTTVESSSAEAEREFGVAVGEAFPVDKVLEEVKKKGGVGKTKGKTRVVPVELSKIFDKNGKGVPARVVDFYNSLSEEGQAEYLRDARRSARVGGARRSGQGKKKKKEGVEGQSSGKTSREVESAKKSVERRGLDIDLSEPSSQSGLSKFTELSDLYGGKIPSPEVWEAYKGLKSQEERKLFLEKLRAEEGEKKGHEAFEALKEKNAPQNEEMERFFAERAEAAALLEAEVKRQVEANKEARRTDEERVGGGDHTPKENKARFLDVMTRAKEVFGRKVERGEKLKNYFATRSEELNEKAKEYGSGMGGFVRLAGETYNKMSMKKKIALGFGMGAGAAIFSGVSTPLAFLFGTGLAVQRAAGNLGMFCKIEKYLKRTEEKEFGFVMEKDRLRTLQAASSALIYTVVAGVVIDEAVHLASESAPGESVHQWLLRHYPFGEAVAPAAGAGTSEATSTAAPAPEEAPAQETSRSVSPVIAQSAVVPEAASPEASALSSIEVKATPGHGYEHMMKRLWEQLHEKGVELPANANPNSDLARLLAADKDSVDKVVHDIAADPKHQFFRADGSSVRIASDAHMTIGARGELFLSDAGHEYQVAPAHAPVTPMASSAVPNAAPPMVTPGELDPYFVPAQSITHQEVNPLTGLVNEQAPAPVEMAVPRPTPETLISPEPIPTIEAHDTYESTPQSETFVPSVTAEVPHSIVNSFGIEVQTLEPHLYADSTDHIFAYGGSSAEKMKVILEYLTKNPDKIIYASGDSGEYRIPWHLADGKVVPAGAPVQTSGFLGFFKDFMKAPSPDEFEKIIK